MTAAPRVALVSGFWGQNIGNAFFNIGGKWILEQIFGVGAVDFIQDQPGYRTFNNQAKGNPKNDFGLLQYLEVDYIVLQGPVMTRGFDPLWRETLRALKRRGTQIILLGSAFHKYTAEEIAAAQRFVVEEVQPAIIVTRDARAYELVKDLAPHTYNGLDSAFFAPKAYRPFKLALEPFLAFNFDRYPEPTVTVSDAPGPDRSFEWAGRIWSLAAPKLQPWFSRRGKATAYVGHLLDRRPLPASIDGWTIVRPEHRFNPHITWKIYQHPNAVASDEPFTYFTVYANAAMTLSDRVHACVATLAYGNPAMLFTPSPRAAIFERVGLPEIRERPARLDPDWLEAERMHELDFLTDAVAKIGGRA